MDDLSSDTGLAGAIVNQDPKLTADQLAKLAIELASGTFKLGDVLQTFNITVAQFERHIETNPYFKQAYDAAVLEWNSAKSAVKRIKIKSATSLEQSLPTLHRRLNDNAETLPAVVETAKLLAKLAGAGEEAQKQASSGERFTISINIGSKKVEQTVEPVLDLTPVPALEKLNE